jgi:hypothetical protein
MCAEAGIKKLMKHAVLKEVLPKPYALRWEQLVKETEKTYDR